MGVSATKQYQVNSLAVPRKAKEAIGGIARLTHADGRSMVINVEYNQPDPLLRATINPEGDANCETGFSPFPGNINQAVVQIGEPIKQVFNGQEVEVWPCIVWKPKWASTFSDVKRKVGVLRGLPWL